MKKLVVLFLVAALCCTIFASCGSTAPHPTKTTIEDTVEDIVEEEPSLITVVGAFYGDLGAENGYKDLFVVFDFANDATNRKIDTATVSINGINTYAANENKEHQMYHNGSYTERDYDWIERYVGYSYAVGYGELLGGADPVRMVAHFYFNPNDIEGNPTLTLTVGDQVAEYATSNFTEISVKDEIMQVADDYEMAVIKASGKWRLDSIYRHLFFVADCGNIFGDKVAHFRDPMQELVYSERGKNITVTETPAYSFIQEYDLLWLGTPVDGLPQFDYKKFAAAYPELENDISLMFSEYAELADLIVTPNANTNQSLLDKAQALINSICARYEKICDAWGIEMYHQ